MEMAVPIFPTKYGFQSILSTVFAPYASNSML
jgi:hypothetical protein